MAKTKKATEGATVSKSMPKAGKDPKGGLTEAGRRFFAETEGAHLKPGVKGPADTPEKMVRKGSFLRRHYANPRGPLVDPKGQPTRQALQAAAWGEPVPKSEADERKLAAKGKQLLDQYHEAKGDAPKGRKPAKSTGARGGAAKKVSAKKAPAKKAPAKKAAAKKVSAKRAPAKKAVAKKASTKKASAKKK